MQWMKWAIRRPAVSVVGGMRGRRTKGGFAGLCFFVVKKMRWASPFFEFSCFRNVNDSEMDGIFRIVELLHRRQGGKLAPDEERELDEWLDRPGNRPWAERMLTEEWGEETLGALEKYDSDKAYRLFLERVPPRRIGRRWLWGAAALIPLAFVLGLWNRLPEQAGQEEAGMACQSLKGGNSRAILTLSSGRKVVLGEKQSVYIREERGVSVKADSLWLTYERKKEEDVALAFNELTVPRKGEFALKLADGSRVYVNADSRLRYPEAFGDTCREVELCGEAYFEVEKDSLRPFIVKAGNMRVKVLGTVFNVDAYPESAEVKTTLVGGSVEVECGENSLLLQPGEQARLNRKQGMLSKEKVDVALYTAWKNGLFKFERESLENIMTVLARWYDVQVFFRDDALRESLFTGDLKKYDSIEEHLRMLELTTDVQFQIQGNNVFVGYRK